jgi:hypothetical protein
MSWRWITVGLLCACAVGCGQPDDRSDYARFLPGWPEARSAVVTSLTDWRENSPPFPPSRLLDGVVFTDKQRKPGDQLRSFAILSESDVESSRQFTVRLVVAGEDRPRLVRYNVLGRDPVWVFRLEDFEKICHWEHPMNDEESSPSQPPTALEARPRPGPPESGSPGTSGGQIHPEEHSAPPTPASRPPTGDRTL